MNFKLHLYAEEDLLNDSKKFRENKYSYFEFWYRENKSAYFEFRSRENKSSFLKFWPRENKSSRNGPQVMIREIKWTRKFLDLQYEHL